MRTALLALLTATALSTAAFAQTANSPFGAPSAPLTQDELQAIKQEGAARKEAARAAAERRAEKKRAAAEAKAAAAAEAAEAAPVAAAPVEKAIDSTSRPAPVSTPAVIDAAPAPAGSTTDGTTVLQEAVTPPAPAPIVPATPTIVPVPTPVIDPLNSAPAAAPVVVPAAPVDALNPAPAESSMTAPTSMEPAAAGSSGGAN